MSARCQRKTLKGDLMCWRPPIPAVGLCVNHAIEHALEWTRSEWSWRSFYANLDLSNMNRLHFTIDESRPVDFVELSWGTTGCDPVWSIGWTRRHTGGT